MRQFSGPFRRLLLLLMLTSMPIQAVYAEMVASPQEIPGTTRVSAEEIFDLVERLPELILIDSRIESDRRHGYIEDSISLPDIDTSCDSLAKIIPQPDSPVLFYCNGVKCGRSVVASRIALGCGYNQIYWFRGGFEEWLQKKLPFLKARE